MNLFQRCFEHQNLCASLFPESYLQGVVFAVSACPEIPMPMTWIPWLIDTPSPNLSESDLSVLSEAAINGLQHYLGAMKDNQRLLPIDCQFTPDGSTNLSFWCTGVLATHQKLEPTWQKSWQNMQEQQVNMVNFQSRLKRILKLITTFADTDLAKQQAEQRQSEQFVEKLPQLFSALPVTLTDYVDLSGTLASYLDNQFETFNQPINSD